MDVLLRILHARLPEDTIRAFADDIGAVITDLPGSIEILERTFQEFAGMSGLELNIKKTICIPLWEEGLDEAKEILGRCSWKGMKIAHSATYLGFVQGPDKQGKSWDKPIQKFSKRCNSWKAHGAGLFFSTTAYNTFACPVLSYVAQLEVPTVAVAE